MTQAQRSSTLAFRPVDLDADQETCVQFRIDMHLVAFGSAERFHESDGKGAERYVAWLRQKAANLPGCLVHVWQGSRIVGQIEMGKLTSDACIGYVNLFYLIAELRGQGLGSLLQAYAWSFLSDRGCQALRLSASPSNRPAWSFYQRGGWLDLGPRAGVPDVQLLHKEPGDPSAGSPLVINPDHYLETGHGRVFTPERNRQAWELAYARLTEELTKRRKGAHVYLVMGVQGAGKSRWVADNLGRLGPRAVVFDAALPARRHRERLLGIACEHAVPIIGIFVQASLALALARNGRRSVDQQVPREALESVFGMLEAPSEEEGFAWVQTVKHLEAVVGACSSEAPDL